MATTVLKVELSDQQEPSAGTPTQVIDDYVLITGPSRDITSFETNIDNRVVIGWSAMRGATSLELLDPLESWVAGPPIERPTCTRASFVLRDDAAEPCVDIVPTPDGRAVVVLFNLVDSDVRCVGVWAGVTALISGSALLGFHVALEREVPLGGDDLHELSATDDQPVDVRTLATRSGFLRVISARLRLHQQAHSLLSVSKDPLVLQLLEEGMIVQRSARLLLSDSAPHPLKLESRLDMALALNPSLAPLAYRYRVFTIALASSVQFHVGSVLAWSHTGQP